MIKFYYKQFGIYRCFIFTFLAVRRINFLYRFRNVVIECAHFASATSQSATFGSFGKTLFEIAPCESLSFRSIICECYLDNFKCFYIFDMKKNNY